MRHNELKKAIDTRDYYELEEAVISDAKDEQLQTLPFERPNFTRRGAPEIIEGMVDTLRYEQGIKPKKPKRGSRGRSKKRRPGCFKHGSKEVRKVVLTE